MWSFDQLDTQFETQTGHKLDTHNLKHKLGTNWTHTGLKLDTHWTQTGHRAALTNWAHTLLKLDTNRAHNGHKLDTHLTPIHIGEH